MAEAMVGNRVSFCDLTFEDVRIFLCNGVTNVEECGVNTVLFQNTHDLWGQCWINPIIKG